MFCPTLHRDRKFRWNRKRSKREEAAWRDPGHQSIYRCLLRISCFPHQVTEAVCFASLAKRPKNTSFITCQIFQLQHKTSRRQLQKLISLLFNTKVRHNNMLQLWYAWFPHTMGLSFFASITDYWTFWWADADVESGFSQVLLQTSKKLMRLWKTAFKFGPLLSRKVVLKGIWSRLNISGGQA